MGALHQNPSMRLGVVQEVVTTGMTTALLLHQLCNMQNP